MSPLSIAGCNAQYTRHTFAAFVAAQRAMGICWVEFVAQTPHLWCDHIACEDESPLRAMLEEAGIRLAAFTPKAYRYSLYSEEGSEQRNATVAYLEATMRVAKRMGAGLYCAENGRATFDTPRERLLEQYRSNLLTAAELAYKNGVTLCIGASDEETSPVLNTLEEVVGIRKAHLAARGAPFKIVLDTQRMSVQGEAIADWFAAFGDDIALVRLVDGNYHGYRPWGEGCLPCGRYLDELNRCGYASVLSQHRRGEAEVPDPVASDERNNRYLRGVMNANGNR